MNLLKGIGVYLTSNILNALIPFLLLPILTRNLSVADYGQVVMFQTFLSAISAIVGLNTIGAANRKYYDGNVDQLVLMRFNGSCFQILLVSFLLLSLVGILFKAQLAKLLSIPDGWVLYAVLGASFLFITNMRLGQWQIRNKAKLFGLLQVGSGIINMLLSVIFVVFLQQSGEGRIDAIVISSALSAVLSMDLLYRDKLIDAFSFRLKYLKEALLFGVPLLPHALGMLLLTMSDRFIINHKLGVADVGIYMVALQLSSALAVIFDAINKAFVPWLFDRLKNECFFEKLKIVKVTYCYMLSLLFIALLAFFIAPYIVVMIAGDKYIEAGRIIGWVCLGQIFSGMYLMVTNYIFYAKKTQYLSLTTIISGMLGVALLFIGVTYFSLLGAAVAFALAKCIHFVFTFYISNKVYPMPWGLRNDSES
ncbi:oligosaccharide flippase family protein [Edwardsiella piscicida]|uniref:lipopolysaccharide biosynthesis protein n=1 Tax=Edwardsiella piscicida TaxID=1263550 RepID=UPI000D51E736|nr:oligosaccharide flippase family protein [Edwardsiella piscicida]EKS7791918.1 oligosaccharide flippase family protein [Edwardsiella piscicida]UCQ15782.1 oligosaccharide flippase family protein [Edwardsiella piscicida]